MLQWWLPVLTSPVSKPDWSVWRTPDKDQGFTSNRGCRSGLPQGCRKDSKFPQRSGFRRNFERFCIGLALTCIGRIIRANSSGASDIVKGFVLFRCQKVLALRFFDCLAFMRFSLHFKCTQAERFDLSLSSPIFHYCDRSMWKPYGDCHISIGIPL